LSKCLPANKYEMTSTENHTPDTDASLLEQYLDGEEDAFARLVQRYEVPLYGFLSRYLGDEAAAEDTFQETFVQVHRSAGAFDTSRPFKPWLYTIALNKARDALRRRGQPAVSLDASMGDDDENSFSGTIPTNISSPEEISMNREAVSAVRNIVEDMPDKYRSVLVLCYFQELTNKEVSEIIGIPEGTVKSRLHAAVRDFSSRWEKWAGDEGSGNE